MSFFSKMFKAATDGFNKGYYGAQASAAMRQIKEHLATIEWEVATTNDNVIGINFRDPHFGMRQLAIIVSTDFVVLSAVSAVEFDPNGLPELFPMYLLTRNHELTFGAWRAFKSDTHFGFAVNYTLMLAGLEPHVLKVACDNLLKEVQEVDAGLRRKGII